jgi:hypothetical protein
MVAEASIRLRTWKAIILGCDYGDFAAGCSVCQNEYPDDFLVRCFFPLALFHTSVTDGPSAASRPSEP